MPAAFYQDWVRVAQEEARHFTMLRDHLRDEGHAYGDFAAHDCLWTMCESTRHDVTARMALVPRTLEARGLDATPVIQAKLQNWLALPIWNSIYWPIAAQSPHRRSSIHPTQDHRPIPSPTP